MLQAIVFGAAHATYPAQPAYARLVELVIPSLGFGLIYLRWGLLPAVVLHFAYDVVWFALPVFVSSAPGARVDQGIVVALTLVPLWVVVGRRLTGSPRELAPALRNGAWMPPPPPPVGAASVTAAPPLEARTGRALIAAGVTGLMVWATHVAGERGGAGPWRLAVGGGGRGGACAGDP